MDPITLGITAISAATSLFGANKQRQAEKEARFAQEGIDFLKDQSSTISTNASIRASRITKQLEESRKQEALYASVRARREVIRQAQAARETSVARAAASGSLNSSAFQGSVGSIAGEQAERIGKINQDTNAALETFAANNNLLQIQEDTAVKLSRINKGIANLGGTLNTAQADIDFGKSLFSTGINTATNAGQYSDVLKSLFSRM